MARQGGETVKKRQTKRTIAGQDVMDVATLAGRMGTTDKTIRAKVARRAIPFRRWNGRIIFLRQEIEEFFENLPGCTAEEARADRE